MMKKLTLTILLGLMMMFSSGMAIAENYTYKLYDPVTNKSYTAQMITLSASETHYYIGLGTSNGIPCILDEKVNTNSQGLIGGKCYGAYDKVGQTYSWREYRKNTYQPEYRSIMQERQGKTRLTVID